MVSKIVGRGNHPNSIAVIKQFRNDPERIENVKKALEQRKKDRVPRKELDTILKSFLYQDIAVTDRDGNEVIMTSLEHTVAALIKLAVYDHNLPAIQTIFKEIRGGADKIEITNKTDHQSISPDAKRMLAEAGVIFVNKPEITDAEFIELDDTDLFDE